jgi:hypothetical protein
MNFEDASVVWRKIFDHNPIARETPDKGSSHRSYRYKSRRAEAGGFLLLCIGKDTYISAY